MPHAHGLRDRSLRVARVPGKGRGIVAGRRYSTGEEVDSTPVVVVPARQWQVVRQTVLGAFCFSWDDNKGSVAVALGLGSLLNHSYEPNVEFVKKLHSRVIVFSALRDIDEGEELTLNYNGDADCRDPVWFDVK